MSWYKIAQQESFPFYDETISEPPNSDPTYQAPKTVENLEEILFDIEGFPAVVNALNKFEYQWEQIQFPEDTIIRIKMDDGDDYVIPDADFVELECPVKWITNMNESELYSLIPPDDYDDMFWRDEAERLTLYHSTTEDNNESILRDGLIPKNKTRGINNRGTGSAIFTSIEPDEMGHYGDYTFEINVGQMKADGYIVPVGKETPIEEAETRERLARRFGLDLDFKSEYESEGLHDSTYIFYGPIPAKYLRLV